MAVGKGGETVTLTHLEVAEIIEKGTPVGLIEGKRILVLTPDGTRTAPLPMMVRLLHEIIGGRAKRLDFMVALGTHRILSATEIFHLYGISEKERKEKYKKSSFYNHRWDLKDTFVKIGKIKARVIKEITEGVVEEGIDVEINQMIFDYDLIIFLGPVFPHEVVGFSGGYKYLFPGISGGEFLHFLHWLGAINTCMQTIGRKDTPTRRALLAAADLVTVDCHSISMVVRADGQLAGLFVGSPEESWGAASDISSRIHIVYKEHPFTLILGKAQRRYDELWTAGKVMYKLGPVVADHGTLIIYGEHIDTVSHTWGKDIQRIGYHVRDYFLGQMEKFRNVPKAVLAHSIHVKGVGTFKKGREIPRIDVVLSTSIPEKLCRKINLSYMNPEEIFVDEYKNREDEGILFVENAGEILYRLKGVHP